MELFVVSHQWVYTIGEARNSHNNSRIKKKVQLPSSLYILNPFLVLCIESFQNGFPGFEESCHDEWK